MGKAGGIEKVRVKCGNLRRVLTEKKKARKLIRNFRLFDWLAYLPNGPLTAITERSWTFTRTTCPSKRHGSPGGC
jgi:hypothetical protein